MLTDLHQVVQSKQVKKWRKFKSKVSHVNSYNSSSTVAEKASRYLRYQVLARGWRRYDESSWKETAPSIDPSRRLIIWLEVQRLRRSGWNVSGQSPTTIYVELSLAHLIASVCPPLCLSSDHQRKPLWMY